MRIEVLDSITQVSEESWNSLIPKGSAPVLKHQWISAMEQSGSATKHTGWEPHHFTAWEGRALVGAAPAYRKHHSMGEYIYDFGWAQAAPRFGVRYHPKLLIGLPLSPLTAPRFLGEPSVRSQLLRAAVKAANDARLSSVHVLFSPEDEATTLEAEAPALLRRKTMQYHFKNQNYATYDDFLSRFTSKRRNQLKRERSAASEQGINIRTLRGAELTSQHAQLAYRFYESTCLKNAWGTVQLNEAFFHQVFETMPDEVELVVAERESKVIAGAFNLASPSRLYGRYWGAFEEHPFLHFHVCLYHSIDDCIQRKLSGFEPGAGGEHKIARGFEPTAIHSLHAIRDEAFRHALGDFCKREAHHTDQILEQSRELTGLKPAQ